MNKKIKFSIRIILIFIVFTIIGTLTHELGHIAVAKYLGYNVDLNYGSMNFYPKSYNTDEDVKMHKKLFLKNSYEIENELPFEDEVLLKFHLERIKNKYPYNKKESLLVSIGGPVQTILTCFLGLLILFYRKSKRRIHFELIDWLGVFLSLFILREIFNTVIAIFNSIFFSINKFYGDEFNISILLGLNQWIVPIITMLIGVLVSMYVLFKVIPRDHRVLFITSGLVGGVLGYAVWFGFFGQLLFPIPISF